MKIGLIGCGKAGTTIFYLLRKNNHIIGVYDTVKHNKLRAQKILKLSQNVSLQDLCKRSQAIFYATPDAQIKSAFQKTKPFLQGEKYLFHFSALLPAEVFAKRRRIFRAAIHPFATFPKILIPPPQKKYFVFTQGDKAAIRVAKQIFSKRYFTLKPISRQDKAKYHLTGVFASNLLVGFYATVQCLAADLNWSEAQIRRIVVPLIEQTLFNIKTHGIEHALSGPLERGDMATIKKHLGSLKKDKNLLTLYKLLSLAILENIPLKKDKIKALKQILNP